MCSNFVFASDLPRIQFSVKPNLCVLSDGEEVCRDELQIRWQSEERLSLCLYQMDKRLPLRCWEGEFSGMHQTAISASTNIDFELRDMSNKHLLVMDSFEVVQDNSRYRQRRRNAWSFF